MSHTETSLNLLVLKVTQTSEHFLKVDFLSANEGLESCLFRYSPKKAIPIKPEIFDTANVSFDLKKTLKPRFIKEYFPAIKRSQIGMRYKQLVFASKFSQFLIENASHAPDPVELFELVSRSLDAYENGYAPEIITLKVLYNFLKSEGFPVQASWWKSIHKSHQVIAKQLLTTPLSKGSQSVEDAEFALYLLNHLSLWIERESDLKSIEF